MLGWLQHVSRVVGESPIGCGEMSLNRHHNGLKPLWHKPFSFSIVTLLQLSLCVARLLLTWLPIFLRTTSVVLVFHPNLCFCGVGIIIMVQDGFVEQRNNMFVQSMTRFSSTLEDTPVCNGKNEWFREVCTKVQCVDEKRILKSYNEASD